MRANEKQALRDAAERVRAAAERHEAQRKLAGPRPRPRHANIVQMDPLVGVDAQDLHALCGAVKEHDHVTGGLAMGALEMADPPEPTAPNVVRAAPNPKVWVTLEQLKHLLDAVSKIIDVVTGLKEQQPEPQAKDGHGE